jgi:hypothetical protein
LAAFDEEVRARIDPRDPSSFWRCEAAFGNLLTADVVTRLVNRELQILAEDPQHLPTGLTPDGQWLVGRSAGCTLIVRSISGAGGRSAHRRTLSASEHGMIGHVAPPHRRVVARGRVDDDPDPTGVLAGRAAALGVRRAAAKALRRSEPAAQAPAQSVA